jgi:Zn-dependent M28 family amino/carboxypeptidase
LTALRRWLYLGTIGALFILAAGWYGFAFLHAPPQSHTSFDGERALRDVETQVAFGPRIPGSDAHARALAWMQAELAAAGWQTQTQSVTYQGHDIENLIASRSQDPPQIIVGAHYDSRLRADRDPDPSRRTDPVPGANDGGSGVAVLLELARTLPPETVPVWLVFFDAEDNGRIPGWDWILGSEAFVANSKVTPGAMVLVDMVGGTDLHLPMEGNSDPTLRQSIWNTAAQLGHGAVFEQGVKYSVEDDHLPFIRAGIPAVDIIDLDYPYWHTTSDTPEHVSAKSLQTVGDVLETWLVQQSSVRK